jgi:hypothetical protein
MPDVGVGETTGRRRTVGGGRAARAAALDESRWLVVIPSADPPSRHGRRLFAERDPQERWRSPRPTGSDSPMANLAGRQSQSRPSIRPTVNKTVPAIRSPATPRGITSSLFAYAVTVRRRICALPLCLSCDGPRLSLIRGPPLVLVDQLRRRVHVQSDLLWSVSTGLHDEGRIRDEQVFRLMGHGVDSALESGRERIPAPP